MIRSTVTAESNQDSLLRPGAVIETALRGGLISTEDIVCRDVLVDQIGRSHPVFRLSVDDEPIAILKCFGPKQGGTDGNPARERLIAQLCHAEKLAEHLVPELLDWSGPDNIIVSRAISGAAAWSFDEDGGGALNRAEAWQKLVSLITPRLAAFHRGTRHFGRPGANVPLPFQAPPPWGLRVFDGDVPHELWQSPNTAAVLREFGALPHCVAAIREARAHWRQMCLIHGDLKHDNILLLPAGAPPRITIVDWEMSQIGDPAWDLACLAGRIPMSTQSTDTWPAHSIDQAVALIQPYALASKLNVPSLCSRLARYVGAVLLMACVQYASTLAAVEGDESLEQLKRATRDTLKGRAALTQHLLERVDSNL